MFRTFAVAAVVAVLPFARAGAQSSATPGRPVGQLAPVTITADRGRGSLGRATDENRRLGTVLDRQEKEIVKLESRLAQAKAANTRKVAEVEATEQQVAELRKRRLALEAQLNGHQ